MALDEGIIKKSEMNSNTTYLLCPDPSCGLFFNEEDSFHCKDNCPKQSDLVQIILCRQCSEIIELPGDHSMSARVKHECPDGRHPFMLRPGVYQLIYRMHE